MTTGENRTSTRVSATHVMVRVATRDRFRSSYLKDLSEGGLFVRSDKPLPVGAEVVIDLLPPGWSEPLRLCGQVLRCEGAPGAAGMAVRFDGNEPEVLARLQQLVAEYQAGAEPGAEGAPEQLQRLLAQYADAATALEKKEAELAAERVKREQATARAATLAAELEAARARGLASSEPAAAAGLAGQLAAAQHEVSELRTRLAEVEGELAAHRQELDVLEEDDATSRRLASGLAKQKAELTADVAQLTQQLAEMKKALADSARRSVEQVADLEVKEAAERELSEQLAAAKAELEELRIAVPGLQEKLAGAEGTASAAKAELEGLARKLAQAEAAAREANVRADRARAKEREVRALLAELTARSVGDEVVVDGAPEGDAAPRVAPPPVPRVGPVASTPSPAPRASDSAVAPPRVPPSPSPAQPPAGSPPGPGKPARTSPVKGTKSVEAAPSTLEGRVSRIMEAIESESAPAEPPPAAAAPLDPASPSLWEAPPAGAPAAASLPGPGGQPVRAGATMLFVPGAAPAAPAPVSPFDPPVRGTSGSTLLFVPPAGSPPAPAGDLFDFMDPQAAGAEAPRADEPVPWELPGEGRPVSSPSDFEMTDAGPGEASNDFEMTDAGPETPGPLGSLLPAPEAPKFAGQTVHLGPDPFTTEPSAVLDLHVTVEDELEPVPPLDRKAFEQKLRNNLPLVKTARFEGHEARGDDERNVMALLEAGERFSELIVLGRGVVTPPGLIEALLRLAEAGAIGFKD